MYGAPEDVGRRNPGANAHLAPHFVPKSAGHVVEHTSRSLCGQIGSHKSPTTLPQNPQDMASCSRSQIGHVGRPIAAGCRHACIRLHGRASWGLHGGPSASLIYAPADQPQSRCQDWLADQAHLIKSSSSAISSTATRPAVLPDTTRCHSHPLIHHVVRNLARRSAIPNSSRRLHRDPRQCQDRFLVRCSDFGWGGPPWMTSADVFTCAHLDHRLSGHASEPSIMMARPPSINRTASCCGGSGWPMEEGSTISTPLSCCQGHSTHLPARHPDNPPVCRSCGSARPHRSVPSSLRRH